MSQRLALIIGNSEYQDTSLARLVTPVEDVDDLAKVLRDPEIGGFDKVAVLVNYPFATIRRAIASFFTGRKRNDLLLLYFSGHGVLDDRGRLYLAVKDTAHNLLRGTAIPAAFITDEMDSSRSRRQVLILDCCHSGAFARGAKGAPGASVGTAIAFEGTGYGRVVLTATDATQYAWEGDHVIGEAENSVFTHYLVQGLQTGAADANANGRVTLDELYDYVYERVVNETPRQTPGKWSYKQQGEIVIARNPRPPVVEPIELLPELQQAIENPLSRVREGAVHELERLMRGSDEGLLVAARAALERLADDDSRQVSAAAVESLAVYDRAQRVKKQVREGQLAVKEAEAGQFTIKQAKAERPAAAKVEAKAEQPVRTISQAIIGWGIGWGIGGFICLLPLLVPILAIAGVLTGGDADSTLYYIISAILGAIAIVVVGVIGALISARALQRTESFTTRRQILVVAIGWAISWTLGWTIGVSVTIAPFFGMPWPVIPVAIIGALGGSGTMLWQLGWTRPSLKALPWTSCRRLVVLFLLLVGFFGPWTQISACGANEEPPETLTGAQALIRYPAFVTPLFAPVLLLFIVTLLRLGSRRLRNDDVVIWLERLAAVASPAGIGGLMMLAEKVLWGLWTTAAGALLALLNLIAELVTTRKRNL